MFDFRFNTPIPSLNQGQGSVFKVRECAQSILPLEKSYTAGFPAENRTFFDFRFNTPTTFPESGSRKHFHASGMRAIDLSPRNYPKKSVFRKKSEKIFFSIFRDQAINVTLPLINLLEYLKATFYTNRPLERPGSQKLFDLSKFHMYPRF